MQIFWCENENKQHVLVLPQIANVSSLLEWTSWMLYVLIKLLQILMFLQAFFVLLICFEIEICHFFYLLIGAG